jgi:hypothetical protein
MMRRIGLVIAFVTLAVSGYYVLAYLYWWEWNRALIAGVFFLSIEIAVAVFLVLARLRRLEQRMEKEGTFARHQRTVSILHETAPRPRSTFAWLDPKRSAAQSNVFVPILLGAGVILSGLAWVIERAARMLAAPSLERGLAAELDGLQVPPGGFLRPRDDALLLHRPVRR